MNESIPEEKPKMSQVHEGMTKDVVIESDTGLWRKRLSHKERDVLHEEMMTWL